MLPSVFVSSTCYDLGQVRADIREFIESLGFKAVLSEYNSFPIDPNAGTIDNCLRNIDNFADILVLIIGGRHGYEDESGKSVTNLEYLRARAKQIPIYVFIDKKVHSILPIWRDNPSMDFKSVVQTPKLFEFINQIITGDNIWVFSFEHAQEITDTLRKQFAHLFFEGLSLRQRLIKSEDYLEHLKGEELRIVIEKPLAWEYLLFCRIVANGIRNASYLRRDVKFGIAIGKGDKLDNILEVINWIFNESKVLIRLSSSLTTLINETLQEALGAPGEPGNPEFIIYVAEKFVEAYKSALEWTIHVRKTSVPDECEKLISLVADLCKNIINEIEEFSQSMSRELNNAIRQFQPGKPMELELFLNLTVPDMTEYSCEFDKLVELVTLRKFPAQ